MRDPEIVAARVSFSPYEFDVLQGAVEKLKRLPEAHSTLDHDLEDIFRHWRGMSEVEIRQKMRKIAKDREDPVKFNGTVIAGAGSISVRATLTSENPILASAARVIKDGPPQKTLTTEREYFDWFWEPEFLNKKEIAAHIPEDEPLFGGSETVEDFSGGTGLKLVAANVRTGRISLGSFYIPAPRGDDLRYDIGFTMDSGLSEQDVSVSILERDKNGSTMSHDLVEVLPHIRLLP